MGRFPLVCFILFCSFAPNGGGNEICRTRPGAPSLFILGAVKGGTTALHANLRGLAGIKHPPLARKELFFFNDEVKFAKGDSHYAQLLGVDGCPQPLTRRRNNNNNPRRASSFAKQSHRPLTPNNSTVAEQDEIGGANGMSRSTIVKPIKNGEEAASNLAIRVPPSNFTPPSPPSLYMDGTPLYLVNPTALTRAARAAPWALWVVSRI